jgi:hypothetical protein
MCDYSLAGVASRPARVAETLISTQFSQGSTRGFASVDDNTVAVCLRPGTEIAFLDYVQIHGMLFHRTLRQQLARFRKVNIDEPHCHHDALEFADGTVVLMNDLVPEQRIVIVQLPADPNEHAHGLDEMERAAAEKVSTQ